MQSLERDPSRHLQQPRSIQIGGDVAELRISDDTVRATELHTIEQVERLHPELEGNILTDRRVFVEGKVIVRDPRSAQLIIRSGFVAVGEQRHRDAVEAGKIEIVIRAPSNLPSRLKMLPPIAFAQPGVKLGLVLLP